MPAVLTKHDHFFQAASALQDSVGAWDSVNAMMDLVSRVIILMKGSLSLPLSSRLNR